MQQLHMYVAKRIVFLVFRRTTVIDRNNYPLRPSSVTWKLHPNLRNLHLTERAPRTIYISLEDDIPSIYLAINYSCFSNSKDITINRQYTFPVVHLNAHWQYSLFTNRPRSSLRHRVINSIANNARASCGWWKGVLGTVHEKRKSIKQKRIKK